MSVRVGLLARIEAKPGREEEVAALLRSALPMAEGENATVAWFAVRFAPQTFAIFDAFADDVGRSAHLKGQIAGLLTSEATAALLAEPPTIEPIEVLAAKMPSKGP